ncbi:MAG: DUF2630 family protein [Ignavibacteriales bacterium]|nr:MAG: DUF2630 family protein [Ignavibacteriales bacterium]
MNQKQILEYIKKLTDEEQMLYAKGNLTDEEFKRKNDVEKEIDQYFDLLRQRRALRSAGKNPEEAKLRKIKTVEHYEQ